MQPSSRGEAGKSTCTSHGLWEKKWEFIGLDWNALRWCLQTQLTLKSQHDNFLSKNENGHNGNGEGRERNELTDYIGPKNDLWPPSSQTLTFEDKSMKLSKVSIPIQFQICHQPNWKLGPSTGTTTFCSELEVHFSWVTSPGKKRWTRNFACISFTKDQLRAECKKCEEREEWEEGGESHIPLSPWEWPDQERGGADIGGAHLFKPWPGPLTSSLCAHGENSKNVTFSIDFLCCREYNIFS